MAQYLGVNALQPESLTGTEIPNDAHDQPG
jgi:hypothetical protein